MSIALRVVATDADYEAWRQVRLAVVPAERCDTVAELRRDASPTRLLVLAERDGVVVGSGTADLAESEGTGFVAPRVLPDLRRQGIGTAILAGLIDHVAALDLPQVRANAEDPAAVAFAEAHGFTESDRQVEQLRAIGTEPHPGPPPAGLEIVALADRPELWAQCFERFGQEVLADFALDNPLHVTADQWNAYWAGDPMFLALAENQVVGCAGVDRDTDKPERGELALTAVRRDWRGRGVAAHLKRLTHHWAADNGLTQLYTWTQRGNADMRRLNEHLGYTYGTVSVTMSRIR